MGHLVDDLGHSYITDFFSGAYFVHEGQLYRFQGMIGTDKMLVSSIKGKPLSVEYKMEDAYLPSRILESFTKFSWPTMGYRNYKTEDAVLLATFVNAVRSTRRGLSEESLSYDYDMGTSLALQTTHNGVYPSNLMYQIFFPRWFTFKEALTLLKDKVALSVALNPDVCIAHHVDANDRNVMYDIMFRGRPVGGVMKDGSITFKNKGMNKMKMFKRVFAITE